MADDNEFFDILYQQWSKTTGAEKTYWMPEEFAELFDGYKIVSFNPETNHKETVAMALTEVDAEFLCGLHGALPDLVRRLHEAIDEAESKDAARDRAEGISADLAMENMGLREQVRELEREIADLRGVG